MPRVPFCFADIAAECRVESGVHRLDGRRLGLRITVPQALRERYPYCGSAYGFLQELRREILDYGLVEFPGLPLNPQTTPWLSERLSSINTAAIPISPTSVSNHIRTRRPILRRSGYRRRVAILPPG